MRAAGFLRYLDSPWAALQLRDAISSIKLLHLSGSHCLLCGQMYPGTPQDRPRDIEGGNLPVVEPRGKKTPHDCHRWASTPSCACR